MSGAGVVQIDFQEFVSYVKVAFHKLVLRELPVVVQVEEVLNRDVHFFG